MPRRAKSGRRSVPSLRRRGPQREPKRRFILYCEGTNTEPAYFRAVRHACSSALISVESHGGIGVPMTIAKAAKAHAESAGLSPRSRLRKNSFERQDQAWAVFDRDEHPEFEQAVQLCELSGVRVARSNPCIELWLILHERDYNRSNRRQSVQADLKALRPEYDPRRAKTPDCDELVRRVKNAEERAAAQLRERELNGNPYGNPSTTVGNLTRAIREADTLARPRTR